MNYNCKDKIVINGGKKLEGTFVNQTSKNAVLPIMSASIMCDGIVKLYDVPNIVDVFNMKKIMSSLGVKVRARDKNLFLNSDNISFCEIDDNLSKSMRSSIFLLGALLSKFKRAKITLPGGCKIGARPIDLHIKALKKLNVKCKKLGEHLIFDASKARANKIKLKIPSVGASENIIQFACKLKGKTTIINPAREPEVVDLCNFLNKAGAKIVGAGSNKITIYGVDRLCGVQYYPIRDRIVSGTIMVATALTGGDVRIIGGCSKENESLIKILCSMGCQIETKSDIIHITREKKLVPANIETGYYPKFPTDLQTIMLTLLSTVEGKSVVSERVFENRFLTVCELNKMGANISLKDAHTAVINGTNCLAGSIVEVADLRGGASLVLAGLVAKGETIVSNVRLIDRGYDHIENMLSSLGADVRRICQKQK